MQGHSSVSAYGVNPNLSLSRLTHSTKFDLHFITASYAVSIEERDGPKLVECGVVERIGKLDQSLVARNPQALPDRRTQFGCVGSALQACYIQGNAPIQGERRAIRVETQQGVDRSRMRKRDRVVVGADNDNADLLTIALPLTRVDGNVLVGLDAFAYYRGNASPGKLISDLPQQPHFLATDHRQNLSAS